MCDDQSKDQLIDVFAVYESSCRSRIFLLFFFSCFLLFMLHSHVYGIGHPKWNRNKNGTKYRNFSRALHEVYGPISSTQRHNKPRLTMSFILRDPSPNRQSMKRCAYCIAKIMSHISRWREKRTNQVFEFFPSDLELL